jgi:hypothetical protein
MPGFRVHIISAFLFVIHRDSRDYYFPGEYPVFLDEARFFINSLKYRRGLK